MTRRQEIAEMLRDCEMSFDELRRELRLGARELEDELDHIARSARQGGEELVITPPQCRKCHYRFEVGKRPTHAPRRCPACKAERVAPPRFRVR